MVVAIVIELRSRLYKRHETETENTCLFDGLPGPAWVALFGVEMSTPTVHKMLKSWIGSYSNCTGAFYKWRRVSVASLRVPFICGIFRMCS